MNPPGELELTVSVDEGVLAERVPPEAKLVAWVGNALAGQREAAIVDLRLTSITAIQALNRDFRDRDRPTNVLSFPAGEVACPLPLLGDIAICPDVVASEAAAQGKVFEHHFAHLVTHGVLHLLGYDHIADDEADIMEQAEREILARLGIDDPYRLPTDAPI